MEEYIMIEKSGDHPNVVLGKYSKDILQKHEQKYGEKAAKNVLECAIRIYRDSCIQVKNDRMNNNVLLVGKVQSGKTSNLEMLTGIAFDNNYNLLIIYGGYDKTLLEQTTGRFKKTFGIENCDDEGKPILLSSGKPEDLLALDNDILDELIENRKPIIITVMKRPAALEKVNSVLRKLDLKKVHAYIIDDEGDQAGLNTEKDKANDNSSTYAQILEMKRLLNNPLYFSVTATPQANIFLDEISELRPETAKLIEPGDGYCGGECYHLGNSTNIEPIDPDDSVVMDEGRMPDSLKEAILHFILASTIINNRGGKESTMIIHSYRNKDPHSIIYTMVDNYVKELRNSVLDDELKEIKYKEFFSVYEKLFSDEIRTKISFDKIKSMIPKIVKKISIILKNSDGAHTQGLETMKKYRIYIGGDLLQRGVTFDNLVTTYYTRWAIQGNMDTNLQRARWFGYREQYLDICKIFTTKEISQQYSILTDVEIELWEQFYEVQEGHMKIEDMVISADKTKQRPTRSNVVNIDTLYFSKNWMKQRLGVFDKTVVQRNNTELERFINSINLKETNVGRNDDSKSADYAKISVCDFINLIEKIDGVFENDPFDMKYLYKIFGEEDEINLIVMPDNNGTGRKRSFYTDNIINNIHQGPDNNNIAKRKYNGDTAVVIDKNQINVQIHKIVPLKNKEEVEGCMQYMFAIFIPRTKKYYIRRD